MGPEDVDVQWEIATDDSMRVVIRGGREVARVGSAHAVHVDVDGLDPQRWYWYRFRVRGGGGWVESPVGRTRTAPTAGTSPDRLRFALASCQKFDDGFYTAHQHLANEDVELVLFVGDYIYEKAGEPGSVRVHSQPEAMDLAGYRNRYALYKSDKNLQTAHHAFPWMVIWDDHELSNDYAGQATETGKLKARKQAAYRAFVEHMPLRNRHLHGTELTLYRRLSWGRLANLCLLDTRQYRSAHACGEGVQKPCAAMNDPNRTMLGAAQERWLFDSIRNSPTSWQVLTQQIPFSVVDREPGPGVSYHMDKWDGYPAARDRILAFLAERGRRDSVVLTGDNHNHWCMEVSRQLGQEPVATEFVCTSISSTGDGSEQRDIYANVLADNPHARYLNSRRGYVTCTVDAKRWHTDFRVVPFISRPGAPISTAASFVLDHGASRPQKN